MAELTAEEKAKKAEKAAKAKAARQAKKEAEAKAAEAKAAEEVKTETKKEKAEETISKAEYEKLLAENKKLKQELKASDEKYASMDERMKDLEKMIENKNSVVQVQASVPMVKLRFQSECSDHNVVMFGTNGKFGQITGKSGTFSVSKEAFGGEFRDSLVQGLLASRELIVLDGLTDEERELYGVNYKHGEVLEEKVFKKITGMGYAILDVYDDLCESHKIMLARRYLEEYEKNPKKIDRSLILELNEKSKNEYRNLPDSDPRKKGLFFAVIEAMNKHDLEK